jgi:tRNA nucleotidyltransferase (CCA-adding enzyme)
MKTFLVGRAIRNTLLNLPVSELDKEWVITGASSLDNALQQLHIPAEQQDRYQLARLLFRNPENNKVHFIHDVSNSLEDELATRDLTINAIAMDPGGMLIDPFDGQQDLEEGYLRHASLFFTHQASNLLSISLTAAELARWGFRIAHGTYGLMKKMVADEMPEQLNKEQLSQALQKVLTTERPSEFFRVLHRCGALAQISPALEAMFDDSQSHTSQQLPEAIRSLDNKNIEMSADLREILEQDFGY